MNNKIDYRLWAILVLAVLLGACASTDESASESVATPEGSWLNLRGASPPKSEDPFPNWPYPPEQATELLAKAKYDAEWVKGAGKGTTGAEKIELFVPAIDGTLLVKWKEMPEGDLDGFNNSPRRELAAYAIQRLVLDPEDYVVPSVAAHCRVLEKYREFHPDAKPTLDGANCVFGVLSLWLKDLRSPKTEEDLYDEARFRSDGVYAYFMSNFNIVTYLIDHRDGTFDNFLLSTNDARRQVFSPDNGLSIGAIPYNFFLKNWNKMRIPAVRKVSVERLRKIERTDLDKLAVLTQFERDDQGVYRLVDSASPIDPDDGVSIQDGTVQLGLTTEELDDLYVRIQDIVNWADSGSLMTF